MKDPASQADRLRALAERFRAGDRRALAQLISLTDDGADHSAEIRSLLDTLAAGKRSALKVGITGSAGAGKSTLAAALIRHRRAAGRSVALLACDPASPITGGALLGDRIRIEYDPADQGVFVRSIATRGAAGGLPPNADAIVRLLEAFGYDEVLIETVGAGQDQLAIRGVADVVVLVVTPSAGDEVQWQKAGLLEIADVIAVNKSDLPGADATAASLREMLDISGGDAGRQPVVKITAATGQGVDELWGMVEIARRTRSRNTP
ncbi:MAG: ATP/GTP-binding protein [Planctomycetes bacterium]|nr:ATP/GTP-binding protein [Planctomycetota bacterium]